MSKEIYPLTIIADRYSGVYSGGTYTAWNLEFHSIPREIAEDDVSCDNFWFNDSSEYIVGKGATPEAALTDLEQKLSDIFINTFNSLHHVKTLLEK